MTRLLAGCRPALPVVPMIIAVLAAPAPLALHLLAHPQKQLSLTQVSLGPEEIGEALAALKQYMKFRAEDANDEQ